MLNNSDSSVVAIINSSPLPSGAARYAQELHRAVPDSSRLYSLTWTSRHASAEFPGTPLEPGFNLPRLPPLDSELGRGLERLLLPWSFRAFARHLDSKREAGLKIHYASQLAAPLLRRDDDIVTILDTIAARDFKNQPVSSMILRRYLRFRNILTLSQSVKSEVLTYNPEADVRVIYPSVSPSFRPVPEKVHLRKELGLPLDKNLVLSVSTSQPRKNLVQVLEVLRILGTKFSLVRVGGTFGFPAYSFQNVPDEILNKLYNACDVLLFPTLSEGFGYPVVEAMAVGLPVVASNISVVREIAGDSATLVAPGDPRSMAAAVLTAVQDRDSLAAKGQKRVRELFLPEMFSGKIRDYYRSVGIEIPG